MKAMIEEEGRRVKAAPREDDNEGIFPARRHQDVSEQVGSKSGFR